MGHSAIYQGVLRHRRFYPKSHEFSYSSTLFYIDLDELPELFTHAKNWSVNGTTLGRFRRSDYLDPSEPCLKTAVRKEVCRQTGSCPQGAVRVLTNLRMWGMCFNPVTLYYIFEQHAEKPSLILAQVNNTPWDKRHCYLVPCDPATGKAHQDFAKQFHVSPFNPLQMDYRWVSTKPADTLAVHMENHREGICHMDATLTMKRELWSAERLQNILWHQPWLTIKVPVAIYWQALKLMLKRVPLYRYQVAASKDAVTNPLVLKNDQAGLRSQE